MIVLKKTLSKQQFSSFTTIVKALLDLSKEGLKSDEYLHFYNIRSILQKCLKKIIMNDRQANKISLALNINEFESLKFTMAKVHPNINDYETFTARTIIYDLQKQLVDINHLTLCNNHGEIN